jgi:hypothetical protein
MDEAELEQFYEREVRIQRQETEDPVEKDLLRQDSRENAFYRCPAGEIMTFRFQTTEKRPQIKYYATSS